MDNFWVKVVIAVVVAAAIAAGIIYFTGHKKEPEKTVGDVWQEDDKRLRAEPNVAPNTQNPEPQAGAEKAAAEQPAIKFRELAEEEQAGAEQLFEMAVAARKMARLPGMSYQQMVDYCRQISEKYPGSEFDYKARRMLGEVPRDQWARYGITQEEIDGPKK